MADERRRHPRRVSQIAVDYIASGKIHRSSIENFSTGGVFFSTPGVSSWGKEILLSFNHPGTGVRVFVVGRITRIDPAGLGVRFKREADGCERGLFSAYAVSGVTAEKKGEVKTMGRIRKRRIRWEASSSPEVVKYRLYWSEDGSVGYTSRFVDVGRVTEVVLPDEIPDFPMTKGDVTFGITAFNEVGNESDITEVSAQIDFVVPNAPMNVMIEDI